MAFVELASPLDAADQGQFIEIERPAPPVSEPPLEPANPASPPAKRCWRIPDGPLHQRRNCALDRFMNGLLDGTFDPCIIHPKLGGAGGQGFYGLINLLTGSRGQACHRWSLRTGSDTRSAS